MTDTTGLDDDRQEDPATQAFTALSAKIEAQDAWIRTSATTIENLMLETRKINQSIAALIKTPALQSTPVEFAAQIEAAKGAASRSAQTAVDQQAKAEAARFQDLVQSEVKARFARHVIAGFGCAFLAGSILCLLLGRVSPPGRVLWVTGHADGWDAGAALMQAADPASWTRLARSSQEMSRQEEAIKACRGEEAPFSAATTCVFTLPKPTRTK